MSMMTIYYMYMYTAVHLTYPLQGGDARLLHLAARRGHTSCVERLLTTSGIDVNIRSMVSSCFLNNGLMIHARI